MFNHLKAGVKIWRKITNPFIAAIQFLFFIMGIFAVSVYINPLFIRRAEEISGLSADLLCPAWCIVYSVITFIIIRKFVYETCHKNKDLFFQLAVNHSSEYVCVFLQNVIWYYYYIIILLAVWDRSIAPAWAACLTGTGLFVIILFISCRSAQKKLYRVHIRTGIKTRTGGGFLKKLPAAKLLIITVSGLHRQKGLAAARVLLLAFLVYCGCTQILSEPVFLLSGGFLILLNDSYWKNESRNFRYFSNIGISLTKYLSVHVMAGFCFNMIPPLLIFIFFIKEPAAVILCFGILLYLLLFWYLAQIFIYLTVHRDRNGLILLCNLVLLAACVLPAANLFVLVWLYKTVMERWRE